MHPDWVLGEYFLLYRRQMHPDWVLGDMPPSRYFKVFLHALLQQIHSASLSMESVNYVNFWNTSMCSWQLVERKMRKTSRTWAGPRLLFLLVCCVCVPYLLP
eukprot:s2021_g6.t1